MLLPLEPRTTPPNGCALPLEPRTTPPNGCALPLEPRTTPPNGCALPLEPRTTPPNGCALVLSRPSDTNPKSRAVPVEAERNQQNGQINRKVTRPWDASRVSTD